MSLYAVAVSIGVSSNFGSPLGGSSSVLVVPVASLLFSADFSFLLLTRSDPVWLRSYFLLLSRSKLLVFVDWQCLGCRVSAFLVQRIHRENAWSTSF